MRSKLFEKAVRIILEHEGGYVNDPADPGGETKYGISKRAYPDLNIKTLSIEDAKAIYYRDYWLKIYGDKLFYENLSLEVFDMAVNAGTGTAVKILQSILNVDQDGIIGPLTLKSLKSNFNKRAVHFHYKWLRLYYYIKIARHNPTFSKFIYGWARRVESTQF